MAVKALEARLHRDSCQAEFIELAYTTSQRYSLMETI